MSTESLLEIDEPSFVEQVDDALGSLVDGLAQTERMAAWRVEQVDAIRRFAEVNIPVTTSAGMRSWSQAATARRTAVSEVAAAPADPGTFCRDADRGVADAHGAASVDHGWSGVGGFQFPAREVDRRPRVFVAGGFVWDV
jgi:hypothetical protein